MLTQNATYVQYATGAHEYYNDRSDPQQLRNVYRSLSDRRKADLTAKLAELTSCSGTPACQVR